MNYVKSLNLFGIEAKEVPSITGSGAPTNTTEGAVGCFYMDTDTGNVYKCTAVVDGVYTWDEFEGGGGGSAEGAVLYTEQTLSPEQQAQARENIGVTMSGNVDDGELKRITANMELRKETGGNLIDKTKVSENGLGAGGGIVTDARFCHTDYIEVAPGETLNFKVYSNTPAHAKMRYLTAYNESKVVQKNSGSASVLATYIVPEGVAYIRATFYIADIDYAVLVKGDLPNEYIPYKEPSYYATAKFLEGVVDKLDKAYIDETDRIIEEALCETAHLRLLCFADPHSYDADKYLKYNEIMSRGVIDYLVGLGDYVGYTDLGEKVNYRKPLLDSINRAGRESNRIYVTGNHDASMKPGGYDKDVVFHTMETFDMFYRHLKNGIVVDPEKPYGGYFYIDDSPSKIRLIVLNSSELFENNGEVTWYKGANHMSQRQVDWFANTALKADEDGWSAMVFVHSGVDCGPHILFELMEAAKNKTSFNKTWTEYRRFVADADGNASMSASIDEVNGDTYNVSADYSVGHSVDPIALVHGDSHEKDWHFYNGILAMRVRNDGVHLDDRYYSIIGAGTFVEDNVYYFTDVYNNIYQFTVPATYENPYNVGDIKRFEYNSYLTKAGNQTTGYLIFGDNNQMNVVIRPAGSIPSGAKVITGFVRERDGSLAGDENCEILCIDKDTRTITTIPYGTGSRRVISY